MTDLTFWWKGRGTLFLMDSCAQGLWLKIPYPGCHPRTFLGFVQKRMVRAFISDLDVEEMQKDGLQFTTPSTFQAYIDMAEQVRADLMATIEQINTLDLTKQTNEQLAEHFAVLMNLQGKGIALYEESQQEPLAGIVGRIEEILKEHYTDTNEKMLQLIEPYEFDDIIIGEILWLEMLGKYDELSRDVWLSYMRRCPWHMWNTYDFDEAYNIYRKRFEEEHGDKSAQIAEIRRKRDEHKEFVEGVIAKVGGDELKHLIHVVHRSTIGRMRLKPTWAGVDFLVWDFLQEICTRLNITISDLVEGYLFADVDRALRDGVTVPEEEIARRRDVYIIGHDGNERIFVTGTAAKELMATKYASIHPDMSVTQVKGTVASKGTARGRVRILLSENIADITAVNKRFHRGDILVADMRFGGIIKVDPATGSQTVVASGGELVNPLSVAVGLNGHSEDLLEAPSLHDQPAHLMALIPVRIIVHGTSSPRRTRRPAGARPRDRVPRRDA